MQKAKCGFYATPGMDDSESRTNGFNQVTPRFLELIACGCHILARYPENPDTKYFELHNITPSIESYEQFEHLLNKALNEEVDMQIYADYLKNHYTSKIAKQIMTDL